MTLRIERFQILGNFSIKIINTYLFQVHFFHLLQSPSQKIDHLKTVLFALTLSGIVSHQKSDSSHSSSFMLLLLVHVPFDHKHQSILSTHHPTPDFPSFFSTESGFHDALSSPVVSKALWPAAWASSGSLLEMQTPRPHHTGILESF